MPIALYTSLPPLKVQFHGCRKTQTRCVYPFPPFYPFFFRHSAVRIKKFKMADSIWWPFFTKFKFKFYKLRKNQYKGGFEVADYNSKIENEKFEMADSIWRPVFTITIPRSKMKNSKWRI